MREIAIPEELYSQFCRIAEMEDEAMAKDLKIVHELKEIIQ